MKPGRSWPWVVVGFLVLAAGVFTMGTEIGNTQWIIGLIVAVLGVALLTRAAMIARRGRGSA